MATTAPITPIAVLPPGASTAAATTAPTGLNSLQPSDFVKLLITQLQNQDPTQPMTNSELLQQVSQIGQLQSQNSLQSTLTGLALQNQIGSASTLMGKYVTGNDASNNTAAGIVTSVSVANNTVTLNLDSGQTLPLSGVTGITTVSATTGVPQSSSNSGAQS